jgi:methyl-accepting chemotaxis protein
MSIRNKIIFAFLLMTAFLIIQSIVSVQNNAKLRALVEQAIEKNYQAVASINGLINDLEILRRYEKEYFIYIADVMKKGKYARQWQTTFEESQARLANMIRNPERVYNGEDVLRFSDWKQALQFYGEEFSQILVTYKNIRAGKQTDPLGEPLSIQANGKIHEGKSRLSKALQDATRMSKTKTEESLGIVGKVEDSFQMVKTVSLSLTLAAIVLSVILIFIVPGGISQTLNRLLNVAEQLSRGDLSKPVERSPVPEFDSLAQSLERIRITQLADSQRKGNRRRM